LEGDRAALLVLAELEMSLVIAGRVRLLVKLLVEGAFGREGRGVAPLAIVLTGDDELRLAAEGREVAALARPHPGLDVNRLLGAVDRPLGEEVAERLRLILPLLEVLCRPFEPALARLLRGVAADRRGARG